MDWKVKFCLYFKKNPFHFTKQLIYLYVYGNVHAGGRLLHVHGERLEDTLWNQLFSSAMSVLGSNSDPQAWPQAPLPAESSHQSPYCSLTNTASDSLGLFPITRELLTSGNKKAALEGLKVNWFFRPIAQNKITLTYTKCDWVFVGNQLR